MAGVSNTEIRTELREFRGFAEAEFRGIRKDVAANRKDIDANVARFEKLDDDLRGNGELGVKQRLTTIEAYVIEQKWWVRGIGIAVALDLVGRLMGLV